MVIAAPALNFQPKQATLPVNSFLQRLLLVTDDNITDIIQAYSGETVEVVRLRQKLTISGLRSSPLQLEPQDQLLARSIVLQGSTTKTNYLYIDSKIILERFSLEIRDELISSRQSIDKLLRQNKINIYREILDCGIESAGFLTQYFDIKPSAEIIYRTYLVLIDSLPVMQITEKFPTTIFID